MKRLTIGRLARRAGISRSTLLYYERAGLLPPAGRSAAGYRFYGVAEIERLGAIRRYRAAGLPVSAIAVFVAGASGNPAAILEQRLLELKAQIQAQRRQQRLAARLLAHGAALAASGVRSKARWVQLLRRAGFSETDMRAWHEDFEMESPREHARFLSALGIPRREVMAIRAWSRRVRRPI